MGSAAFAAVPPPPPPAQPQVGVPPYGLGLAGILPPKPEGEAKEEKKVDYLNLPCPVPFEEIQREALSSFPFICVVQFPNRYCVCIAPSFQ
jgi:mitochondrial import receptor subunit TOM40